MIDFRYHLVSLVAVFLALAIGVALGAGPLQKPIGQIATATNENLLKDKQKLQSDLADAAKQQKASDLFASEVTPTLVKGRLAGRRVVVVVLPLASSTTVTATSKMLTSAGATVTGTVTIDAPYLAQNKSAVLSGIVDSLAPKGITNEAGDTVWTKAARALAASVVAPPTEQVGQPSADGRTLLAGLAQVGMVTVAGDPAARRASLAVVVAGTPPATETAESDAETTDVVALADALDKAGAGAVVAGPETAVTKGGVLNALRASRTGKTVSSVDAADSVYGQVAIVLSLVAESAVPSVTGHYGPASGTDGMLPPSTLAPAS